MKDYKHSTIFSARLKSLVSEEKDKYLSMASLAEIGEFIPKIDTGKEIDLLPIAFNACVSNRVNKNGDVIDTNTAREIYKSFINKQINLEHNRERVVGVILTAGFSEFGSDASLTEEEVIATNKPFNITLGGVIWKVTNSSLAKLIEDAADPTSDKYMKISASWELGFTDFHIVAIEGNSKNIEDGVTFSEEEEVEELKEHLKSNGGKGELPDGTKIYRKVINNVVPLGIGLTESPAADVCGIAIETKDTESTHLYEKQPENDEDDRKHKILKNIKNKSSQSKQKNVKESKETKVVMKIHSIKDINEESMKDLQASTISDFIQKELEQASEMYTAEKREVQDKLEAAEEKHQALEKEHSESKQQLEQNQKDLDEMKSQLEALESEKKERENQERFNQRMASLDEEYELNDEDREVIASDIKDFDDEEYEGYTKKLSVLLREKNKSMLEEQAKATEKEQEEAKASEGTEEVVEEALDNADKEEEAVANSTNSEDDSLYEKYKQAFDVQNFEIDTKL